MTNLEPLKELIGAQKIYDKYKDPVARREILKKVSTAVGSETPLPLLGENLDKVFNPDSPVSDVVLTLVLSEAKK